MSYTIIIKQQARKKLQSLAKPDRLRIADKINQLGDNPDRVGECVLAGGGLFSTGRTN